MNDTEILKELKAIIKERAFKHLYEFQRTDRYNFGYRDANERLWWDLKKLERKSDEENTGD